MYVCDRLACVPVGPSLDGSDSAGRALARTGNDLAPMLALLADGGCVKKRVGRVGGVLAAVVGLTAMRPVGLARAARRGEALGDSVCMTRSAVPDVVRGVTVRAVATALFGVHDMAARKLGAVGVLGVVLHHGGHLMGLVLPVGTVRRDSLSRGQQRVGAAKAGAVIARCAGAKRRSGVNVALARGTHLPPVWQMHWLQ